MLPRAAGALALAACACAAGVSLEVSVPYISVNLTLSTREASARVAVGGSYTWYSAGFLSTAVDRARAGAGAEVVAANFDVPSTLFPSDYPRSLLATAGAGANWKLEELNGTLNGVVGAKAYASSIGHVDLALVEFDDKNRNNKIDANETVYVYDLMRSFTIMKCGSNSDLFWCNATSTDRHFNMLSMVSKTLTGRTQFGDIVTPRHIQTVYTITNFPFKGTGTKLALRSLVASASANASARVGFTLSGNSISAMTDSAQLQVFYGWKGEADAVVDAGRASARVFGSFAASASAVGVDNKTVTALVKAFGMVEAEASVNIVDTVIDLPSSDRLSAVRFSSAVGSGPMPEEPGLSTGALVGIIVGAIAAAAVVAAVVAVVVVRKRRSNYQTLG